jgi:hypothetical protein
MSQDAGGWPPQGGYSQGYPSQGQPGDYGQQPSQGGYPPQAGEYGPQGAYGPQAGYPPQGYPPGVPGGYPPVGPGYGGVPPGGPPAKKSPAMIIGIVAAAVVLLAAVGGIILVLNQGDDTQPSSTITPSPPPAEPTTSPRPTDRPTTSQPSASEPTEPTEQPTGEAIELGNGISLTPADGYEVQKAGSGFARLANGEQLFLGQMIQVEPNTNPGQLCDGWHRQIAADQADGKFADPKSADLNNPKIKGASCVGTFTASNGSGSQEIVVYTLVSVRTDGVTVLGTEYFQQDADSDQLNRDFSAMMNSMLEGQLS